MAGRDQSWWLSPNFQRKWDQWGVFRRDVHVYNRADTPVHKEVPHEMGGFHNLVQGA